MTRVCSGCGLYRCSGECYHEDAETGVCWKCREPLVEGECRYCDRLTEVRPDPFAHIRAHDLGDVADQLFRKAFEPKRATK